MNKMQLAAALAMDQAGGPYIFAATGQFCSVSLREKQMKNKPAYAEKIKRYCPALQSGKACSSCRYSGRRAFDCRGLTYWALKMAGLKISSVGATTQWTTDSWAKRGTIDSLPRDQPAILFKQDNDNAAVMAHTGFYLGDGIVVDARGHERGIVDDDVIDYPWTHWAVPYGWEESADDPDPEDDGEGQGTTRPLLRKGARGEDVRYLQTVLIACGFVLPRYGADGSYGAETIEAVMQYQMDRGLDPDGICGPKTWGAIERELSGEQETPEDEEPLYSVTVRHMTRMEAERLMELYDDAVMTAESD